MEQARSQLVLQENRRKEKRDEQGALVFGELYQEGSAAIRQFNHEKKETISNKIVVEVIRAKKAFARCGESPLSDFEYNSLLELYAKLNDTHLSESQLDASNMKKELDQLRRDTNQLWVAHALFEAGENAMTNEEFDQLKRLVLSKGKGLQTKLLKIHSDPLLKSPISDAEYDEIKEII